MDPTIKARWVAALRSGDFTQGQRTLTTVRDGKEYDCCLAVLCKLAIQDGIICRQFPADDSKVWYGDPDAGWEAGTIPILAREWSGIREQKVHSPVMQTCACKDCQTITVTTALIDMNDVQKKSFEEIADWIEENL